MKILLPTTYFQDSRPRAVAHNVRVSEAVATLGASAFSEGVGMKIPLPLPPGASRAPQLFSRQVDLKKKPAEDSTRPQSRIQSANPF